MLKGIILIATSHGYYGRMAFNLAASVKAAEDIHITVVHDTRGISHLSENQLKVFDNFIELPAGMEGGFRSKLHLNELSPYDETIFLDADMLWLPDKKPSQLFEELSELDYTGITEGWYDLATDDNSNSNLAYYYWAELPEIKQVYGLTEGKFYQWRSEVIYFKKNDRINSFFEKAREIHRDSKLTTLRKFAGHTPDELAINISAALHGIEPHIVKWTPAYWHKLHKDIVPDVQSLHSKWYLVSFGSNYANGSIKTLYNRIASIALKKLGMQHTFPLHSKKEFMNERLKM